MQKYALCPECRQSIRLRLSGAPHVVGTFWKHRNPGVDGPDNWCGHGGSYPPPEYVNTLELKTRRRAECPVCHRDTAVRPRTGELYRHRDWHNGGICDGSGQATQADNDNTTSSISAFSSWGFETSEREPTPVEKLTDWWVQKARTEADMVCAKAVEYGATDLRDLGYQVLEMAGRRPTPDPYDGDQTYWDGYATEVGIVFYAQGKLARIVAAVKENRRPSLDSWLDLGVYARMAQRVHENGGWPAV